MAVVGSAEVLIRPAFTGVQRSIGSGLEAPLNKAGDRAGKSTAAKIGSALKKGTMIVGAAVGAGLAYTLTKGMQRLTAIENAEAKLRGLGHSAESVQSIMDNALAAVKGTAFGLDEAATTAASLVAAGIKPGQELENVLTLVGDSATIAGRSFNDMGAIWGKVAATGKLQGDEMNQLMEAGIPILQLLSKHYGKSAEDVRKMVSDGKVKFADFAAAMESGMGGAAQESGKTFSGAVANINASIGRIGANLLSGVFPKFAGAITGMTTAMGPLEDRAKVVGGVIGDRLVKGVGQARDVFEKIKPTLIDFGNNMRDALAGVDWKAILANLGTAATIAGAALAGIAVAVMKILPPLVTLAGKLLASKTAILLLVGAFATWKTITGVTAVISGVTAALNLQAASTVKAGVATKAYGIVMKAQVIWYKAWTIATKAATIATTIFNGVMKVMRVVMSTALGPVGLIITAIGLLVVGFITAYKKSETFRNIVDGALRGIAAAGKWMWNNVLKPVFGALRVAFTAIGAASQWLWKNAIKPAFNGIAKAFRFVQAVAVGVFNVYANAAKWLWGKVLKPVFSAISTAFRAVGKVMKAVWSGFLQPVIQLFAAIVKWLFVKYIKFYVNLIKTVWNGMATLIRGAYNKIIKPIINAYATLGKWLWEKALKPAINAIRTAWGVLADKIRAAYNKIIKPIINAFSSLAKAVKTKITGWWKNIREGFVLLGNKIRSVYNNTVAKVLGAFKRLGGNVKNAITGNWNKIKDGFSGAASKMKSTMDGPMSKVFSAFKSAGAGMRDAFKGVTSKIGDYWSGLKDLAKKPIKFIVETVINKGLIGGFNKMADFFKTKHMKELPVPFARGGILPGRSSWRQGDDQLVSARRGEGWTVSEALRDPYERARLLALNKAALRGESAARFRNRFEGFASGGLVGGSGRFSKRAEELLLRAQDMAGQQFSIFQRGFRPSTSYSGTSHQGDAIDTGPVNSKVVAALRSVGWAAWDRTGKGNWVPHIHAVPLPGAGSAAGSAIWQAQDYLKGGDGLGGRDNGPRGMLGKVKSWLKGKGEAISGAVGGFFETINPANIINNALKKVMKLAKGVLDSPFGQLVAKAPRKLGDLAIEWGKKKLKDFGGSIASWAGGLVGGWSRDQLNNAATIVDVANKSGTGARGAKIGLMTAMQESSLKNLSGGDRDSVGLFQQRAPWGSFGDRHNPRTAARMFYNGGKGGQPGLLSKPWRTMGLGEAAQAVQVSAYPGAYAKWADDAQKILDKINDRDTGGVLKPGLSLMHNGTGSNEAVLTGQQWRDVEKLITLQASQQNAGLAPGQAVTLIVEGAPFTAIVQKQLVSTTRNAGLRS